MKDEIIIKRMNYREPLKNHFEAQKISGRMALFLNGESFSGKLLLEYDSGNLYSEGMIKNGFKEGEWRTFYETGELKILEYFTKGLRKDKYFEYYKNGQTEIEGDFFDDLKSGIWKMHYETGEIKQTGKFVLGKEQGEFILYHLNGNVEVQTRYVDGKRYGGYQSFYKSGALELKTVYRDDVEDGDYKVYYESGNLKIETHRSEGKENGKRREYYENGNLRLEGKYVNGKEEGIFTQYYPNNQLEAEINFNNGKREGVEKIYYENGKLLSESNYKNDKLEGEVRKYGENGKLLEKLNYKNGLQDGIQIIYSLQGKIVEIEYDNGISAMGDGEFYKKWEHNFFMKEYKLNKIFEYLMTVRAGGKLNKGMVVETLSKIPEEVKDFVIENIEEYIKKNEITKVGFDDGETMVGGDVIGFFKGEEKIFKSGNTNVNNNKILDLQDIEISEQIKDTKSELIQEQITKKEADKKFDETRNWLGSRTERTLYKGSIFPVNRFIERIKDFDTDLKERVYRFIDSYTKDWISTVTFDTGKTYELEEALKKFREIMGLHKEEK